MEASMGNTEILQIADAVAREKGISKESVIEALEDAIRVAARRKYGHEHTVKAEIDRNSGAISLFRIMRVVDPVEEAKREAEYEAAQEAVAAGEMDPADAPAKPDVNPIPLEEAKLKKEGAQIDDIISEPLPPIDLGRVAAQSAKQVITHKVREIEREKQFEEFKDKVGEIVSGVIEKVERGDVIVKLGSAEATIRRNDTIRGERFKQGDRIRAYIEDVNKENRGSQIVLSRTHEGFLAQLFAQEVPEIYDSIIQVKAVARDPGSRAKMAVFSTDPSIDPIGSCVGMRGARVQAVINELNGEKIDIIQWSEDPATMVVNALAPAEVTKVVIDEDNSRIEIVVPEEQQSIAIGKRGQNVRLASKLIGWDIDILTEESESKRRADEFSAITEKFMKALDVEEILAQLLATEGFTSIQSIADTELPELASVEGLDEGIAEELIKRSKQYAETHDDAAVTAQPINVDLKKLDPELLKLKGMTEELAARLYMADIKTVLELADLSRDEFVEALPDSELTEKSIDSLIMAARDIAYFNKNESNAS